MASLPLQYPNLAIYLADETNIPIISSAGLGFYGDGDGDDDGEEGFDGDRGSSSLDAGANGGAHKPPSRRQRAAALDALTTTAFRARDAAARLGLGLDCLDPEPSTSGTAADAMAAWGMTPPEHVVVTYNTGAVLIESFLDPLQQQRQQRIQRQQQQQQSLRGELAIRSAGSSADLSENNNTYYSSQYAGQRIEGLIGGTTSGEALDIQGYAQNGDGGIASSGPLLVGLVVAPGEQSLREARRATARLQHIGRAVQQDWAADESG